MRSRGYVIAMTLIVSIVLLQAGGTIAGVVLANRQLDAAALDTYGYVGDLTEERVARYAESAHDVVIGTASQLEQDVDLTRDELALAMYQRLKREPSVRAIYVGWPDGTYLVVRRAGTGFLEQYGGEGEAAGVSRDARFGVVGETSSLGQYDPRIRPWYVAGSAGSDVSWTEPYIEYDTANTLVSAARSASRDGELVAVVGADLSLVALSEILDDLPYGTGAEAFVLGSDQQIIAAPSIYSDTLVSLAEANREVPTAADLGIPVSAIPTANDATSFSRQGSQILLERTFPANENLDWTIHMSADEAQLSAGLGGLGTTLWWITATSLLLLVGAIVFAWRVRHPLRRLRERALTDPLTGLTNRGELMRRGSRSVAAAIARGDRVMVTTLDLDDFKGLNDRYGHDVGDRALIAVALALRACVREGDVVARLGGDEFVTIQVLRQRDTALTIASRVRDEVERELHTRVAGAESVGVTMGVAEAQDGEIDLAELLKRADIALIRGKRETKGSVYDGNSCPPEDLSPLA